MEGRERAAVEARVLCLNNISVLLDAAVLQLQQYTSIVAALRCTLGERGGHCGCSAEAPPDAPTTSTSAAPVDQPSTSSPDSLDQVRQRRVERFAAGNNNA